MRREAIQTCLAAALCAMLGGCVSTGGAHLSGDSSSDKRVEAARVRMELGQRYMQEGKLEIALDNLNKALQYDDKLVDAHTVIAVLYERIGNLKAAEQHYARAAELAPKSGDANNNYGVFLCAEGKFTEAQKYFSAAMRDPFYKTPDVLLTNAGTCLVDHANSSNYDEAERDFRNALQANPKNGAALFYMAKVLYLKNDFFHARAFIQRFESQGKPDPAALLLARNIEVKLGHVDTAHDYAQRLRKDFPDSTQTHSLDTVAPVSQ
ncbi:MAG: type IV pilus biogenesis/stability protein PilW [Rudaea sp.]